MCTARETAPRGHNSAEGSPHPKELEDPSIQCSLDFYIWNSTELVLDLIQTAMAAPMISTQPHVASPNPNARPASLASTFSSPHLMSITPATTMLRDVDTVTATDLPRMADFAQWSVAAEKALPLTPGSFLKAYKVNQLESHELALEASPIIGPLWQVIRGQVWRGTTTQLLAELNKEVDRAHDESGVVGYRRQRGWPTSPIGLGNALHRLAPSLRARGLDVQFSREGGTGRRIVTFRKLHDFGASTGGGGDDVTTEPTHPPQTNEGIEKCDNSDNQNRGLSSDGMVKALKRFYDNKS